MQNPLGCGALKGRVALGRGPIRARDGLDGLMGWVAWLSETYPNQTPDYLLKRTESNHISGWLWLAMSYTIRMYCTSRRTERAPVKTLKPEKAQVGARSSKSG